MAYKIDEIEGIGPAFREKLSAAGVANTDDLLEASGVDTIKELRNRNVENLSAKMEEVNAVKRVAKATPSSSMVEDWIAQAKKTDPKITY